MGNRSRISTDGGDGLNQNPFAALGGLGDLPAGPATPTPPAAGSKRREPNRNRGRVEIRRLTGGKGGKTVTAISGFKGIAAAELAQLAKRMQKSCGAGGTVKGGQIEIQGDKREQVAAILSEAGFRPVMAGG
jgi:translation initiation factor 1